MNINRSISKAVLFVLLLLTAVSYLTFTYSANEPLVVKRLKYDCYNPEEGNQEFFYQTTRPITVEVKLYKQKEASVFIGDLSKHRFDTAGEKVFIWDGKLSTGDFVANGFYRLEIKEVSENKGYVIYYDFEINSSRACENYALTAYYKKVADMERLAIEKEAQEKAKRVETYQAELLAKQAQEEAELLAKQAQEEAELLAKQAQEEALSLSKESQEEALKKEEEKITEHEQAITKEYENPISVTSEEAIKKVSTIVRNDDIVRWNLPYYQFSLDPVNTSYVGDQICSNIYEGLTEYRYGQITIAAANKSGYVPMRNVVTIEIADNRYWSDGEPLTSHDFYYAWARRSKYSYMNALIFQDLQMTNFKIIDDKTFTFDVGVDYISHFREVLARPELYPLRQDIVETYGEDWWKNPETCVTNGPYKVVEIVEGEKVVLEKNEYYPYTPKIERIEYTFEEDNEVATDLFRKGQLDIVSNPCLCDIETILTDPTLHNMGSWATFSVLFNQENGALASKDVRKALGIAIDRAGLVEEVRNRNYPIAYSIIPPEFKFGDRTESHGYGEYASKYDIARGLLAKAGYPNGEGIETLTFIVDNRNFSVDYVEAISKVWKEELGIETSIVIESYQEHYTRKYYREYDIAFHSFDATYNHPSTFFTKFSDDPDMILGYLFLDLPAFYEQMNLYFKNNGQNNSDAALIAAEKAVAEEYIYAPLFHFIDYKHISPRIENWQTDGLGNITFKYAEIVE